MSSTVKEYYDEKTQRIVDRYGPGPRVHYHLGHFGLSRISGGPAHDDLQACMFEAQEELLKVAVEIWGVKNFSSKRAIDLGCGLGGASIFLAQSFSANMTSLTISPEQIPFIRKFSAEAGVESYIEPILGNAESFTTDTRYDAAIAIESLCHMRRDLVFESLAKAMNPGGVLCIEDVFLGGEHWRTSFDQYWETRIGTVDEYIRDAEKAGFILECNVDITSPTADFWTQSMLILESEISLAEDQGVEHSRLLRSLRWHAHFLKAWHARGIQAAILRFRKS